MCHTKETDNNVENDSGEEPDYAITLDAKAKASTHVKVSVNGHIMTLLADSGASVNLLTEEEFHSLVSKHRFGSSQAEIYSFGRSIPIQTRG